MLTAFVIYLHLPQASLAERSCPGGTLLPTCTSCVPGLESVGSQPLTCAPPPPLAKYIAWNAAVAARRYGAAGGNGSAPRLYPYLMSNSSTHRLVADFLRAQGVQNVLDLGPHLNPIASYLHAAGHCPNSTVAVEPIAPAASTRVPCLPPNGRSSTYHISSPLFADQAAKLLPALGLPRFDAIVCLGCFPEQIRAPTHICEYLQRFSRPFTFVVEAGQKKLLSGWIQNGVLKGHACSGSGGGGGGGRGQAHSRGSDALQLHLIERITLEIPEEPTGKYRSRLMAYLRVTDADAHGAVSPARPIHPPSLSPIAVAGGGPMGDLVSKKSKLTRYQQLAIRAEAVAAHHGPLFGAVFGAERHSDFARAASYSATPRHAVPALLMNTSRWVVGCNVERQPHQLLTSLGGNEPAGHCQGASSAAALRTCTFLNEHSGVDGCRQDPDCRKRACEAVRTCAVAPQSVIPKQRHCGPWLKRPCVQQMLSLHTAAAVVCAEERAQAPSEASATAAVVMLGLGWMVTSGAVEPLRYGLRHRDVVRRFSEQFSRYTDHAVDDPASSWQSLRKLLPVPPAMLACPAAGQKVAGPALARRLEPLYPHLRNLMFVEMGLTTSFVPYRILPSVRGFGSDSPARRRILVDIGTNGFHASAKYLLDLYEPVQPFTEAVLFEPDTDRMDVPDEYTRKYNITDIRRFIDVGSRLPMSDLLVWLHEHVTADDFVALKFDVDESVDGPTIEWGFLADWYSHPSLGLVDELFIEMHFSWLPKTCSGAKGAVCRDQHSKSWRGKPHSMQQAFEVLTEMRRCGIAVHAWP